MPPVEEDRLPATMLERFVGSSLTEHMIALLRFSHQNRRASAGSVTDIREAQNTRRRRSSPEGRHPHCHFRGLLRLYACYGPADCSATQGDLCHEASVPPVAQQNRSSASCTFPTRLQEGSGAVARGVERSETTRASAGDGPNGATIQDRADSPGATISFLRSKAPGLDMCPGETAATDAQWGDAPLSASTGTGWGCGGSCVCVFACTINGARHGAD